MAALIVLAVLVLASLLIVSGWTASFRFSSSTPGFRCKIRPADTGDHGSSPWPLRRHRGTWVHDVLLLRRGVILVRLTALPTRVPDEALRDMRPGEVHGLGGHPVAIVLRLDDGNLVEVAAGFADRAHLVGPFLAAAIPGLPPGPTERPTLGR